MVCISRRLQVEALARIAGRQPFVACWSPDGSTIALAMFMSQKVLFLNKVGEVQRTIALKGTRDWIWDLDWSAVNGRLLFVADDDQRRPTIWTIRPDGSEQTKAGHRTDGDSRGTMGAGGDAFYYFGRVNQTVSLYKAYVDAGRHEPITRRRRCSAVLKPMKGLAFPPTELASSTRALPTYSNLWLVETSDAERRPANSADTTHARHVSGRTAARVTRWATRYSSAWGTNRAPISTRSRRLEAPQDNSHS